MQPISIIIPTYNEAENLKALLPLLQWADEILVVDSFSTDASVEIAKQHNARVIQREYINSASQKNWAIPQATHEWIFLIDADERPTSGLIAEVKKILALEATKEEAVAYWIGRDNYFLGKEIKYSGWQNDAVIRLFKKSCCRYADKEVHSEIIANGKVAWLKERFNHYTYKNMSHFLSKMERYAAWSAQDYGAKTGKITWFHLYIKPAFRFFKHYILKQGFRDGKEGLIISKVMAWSVFLRYVMLLEARRANK
jgi:glycosyltransferase involved in cell wall biosynthesis